jgi:putative solute:sodium symporter small subunit
MPEQVPEPQAAYWRKNARLTGALLALWIAVTFGVTFHARAFAFDFFGWPFGFWMGAQGALLVYLAIVGLYAAVMNRLDRDAGEQVDDD